MVRRITAGLGLLMLAACGSTPASAPDSRVSPVYDRETGRLSELLSDRDGDGRNETRAFMRGAEVEHIEIDRDADGVADRFEYYAPLADGGSAQAPWLSRAEEREGTRVVRREQYMNGKISHVEEDTDGDTRPDKWERYTAGVLTAVELDLDGSGRPTRRLNYGPRGEILQIEADADGDGRFEPVAK